MYHSVVLHEGKRILRIHLFDVEEVGGQVTLAESQVKTLLVDVAHLLWTNPELLAERPQVVAPRSLGITLEANMRTTPLSDESWEALRKGALSVAMRVLPQEVLLDLQSNP